MCFLYLVNRCDGYVLVARIQAVLPFPDTCDACKLLGKGTVKNDPSTSMEEAASTRVRYKVENATIIRREGNSLVLSSS